MVKTITFAVLLYDCETLREEQRLKVFENRILRRKFGSKRGKNGRGIDFTMKNFELFRSPNIVRVIKSGTLRWTGHVARIEEGKPTGERPRGRPKRRWEGSIKMDLK